MIKYEKGLDLANVGLNRVTITNTDKYKGYQWYLGQLYDYQGLVMFNSGCNINGYVVIKPNQPGYDEYEYVDQDIIDCHGGITYDVFDKYNNRIIGFDTSHGIEKGWTNEKLENECKNIINQLEKSEH